MKVLNRYSRTLTQNIELGAAQAMLHATVKRPQDLARPQVGIASMWFSGNPCNQHLDKLSSLVGESVYQRGLLDRRFNTIGVSDGISMGTTGMRYSLPSRELICDSIETQMRSMWYDALVAIPGCDKNIPASAMALLRVNRPGLLVYGGSIMPGRCNRDVVTAFQSYGELKTGKITTREREEIIQTSCPGSGACGGMYTANTMAVICEAMGLTLPNSSSNMAVGREKQEECRKVGLIVLQLLKRNLKPREIVTRQSLINGLKVGMALGGSTNMVLHILAIAHEAGLKIDLTDIQQISEQTPFIGNLKPSGKYLMYHLNQLGGTSTVIRYLIEEGLIDGDQLTVTGQTLRTNVVGAKQLRFDNQNVVVPLDRAFKRDGHIQILTGNLAPSGSVAKITGKEGERFTGPARVFNSEEELTQALDQYDVRTPGQGVRRGDVVVIRYQGPSIGMPEMLRPTSELAGRGLLNDVALITDGRFSGGSHGFIVGHISPEAYKGGPIGEIGNGDIVTIDAVKKTINFRPNEQRADKGEGESVSPNLELTGYLQKFSKLVDCASKGCITTPHFKKMKRV